MLSVEFLRKGREALFEAQFEMEKKKKSITVEACVNASCLLVLYTSMEEPKALNYAMYIH